MRRVLGLLMPSYLYSWGRFTAILWEYVETMSKMIAKRIGVVGLSVVVASMLAGCAAPKSKEIENYSTTGYTQPFYLWIKGGAALKEQVLVKIVPKNWLARDADDGVASVKEILDGKPYVQLGEANLIAKHHFRLIDFERIDAIRVRNKGKDIGIKYDGRDFNIIRLAICPSSKSNPETTDCIFSHQTTEIAVQEESGNVVSFNPEWMRTEFALAKKLFSGFGAIEIVATDQSKAERDFVLRADQYKKRVASAEEQRRRLREAESKALAEQRRKDDLEKERILKTSRLGTKLYCQSTSSIFSDGNVTNTSFQCDALPQNSWVHVRELEKFGWEIVSEIRTPRQGFTGVVYEISISLKKLY